LVQGFCGLQHSFACPLGLSRAFLCFFSLVDCLLALLQCRSSGLLDINGIAVDTTALLCELVEVTVGFEHLIVDLQ
tara:strand:- start:2795 stop:3022 length:228 start_codon:yes stop_codon:yes gene_type:complete